MPLNVPILLTWLRILTIPLVIGVFYVPEVWLSSWHQNLLATSLFIAAAITDWLDGYLARRLNQTSAFGAFLDPVADKLIVAAILTLVSMFYYLKLALAPRADGDRRRLDRRGSGP